MRLEIDGKEADLGNNIIAITRQSINLSNLSLRRIDITNRLQLPKSNQNQEIFESADRIETNGDGMDKIRTAKIIDQFFIFNGIGFLNEANSVYNFQLSESSKELFENLSEKINRLSFDQYDFTFNNTSYNNLKLITDNVWVWPIIAMHEDKTEDKTRFTSGDAGLTYSRPCFYFNKVLTDAFEAQGWTIELDTDIIDNLCFSSNAERFYVTSYQKTLDETLILSGEENIDDLNINDFENNVTTASTTINIGTTPTTFRLRGNIESDTDTIIKFISTSSPSGKQQTKEFNVKSDQSYIDLKTSTFKPSSSDTSVSIQVTIEGTGNFTFNDTLLYSIIEEQDLGDISSNSLIGYRVKAFDNMPDKEQVDLFRDAIKITNSIIEPDSFNKIIRLRSLKNLSKLNSYDWSEKFDADDGSFTITNRLTGYAKTNYLIYDNDDTVQSDLGEETFLINNESLPDIADVIKLEWGASEEVEIENQSKTIASFEIYDDTERINDINDRLIYIENQTTYTTGRFLQLDWRSLKVNYYQNWLDSFYRFRIIEGSADLNKLDVIGHDFLKLVYIDKFKSNFFVQIFDDFEPGKKTKVELFKFL